MNTPRPLTAAWTACGLALSVLAAPVAHAQAGIISYTDIADTFAGTPYSQINQGQSPAINNSGQVLFDALTASNTVEHLYVSKPVGGPTDIANTLAGTPHAYFGGGLSLNNAGVAAYASGLRSGGPYYGVYTGNGLTESKIADNASGTVQSAYTGSPIIAETGAVAFLGTGVPAGTGYQLIVGQSGTFTSVVVGNNGQFEYVNAHSLNSAGQVAFNTDDYSTGSNNGAFVYRYNPITHANTQLARAFTGTAVSINEAGVVAYEGAPASGSGDPIGIFTNNGTAITTISRAGQPLPGTNIVIGNYGADSGIVINNRGQVVFYASNYGVNTGIYLGDGTNTVPIARIGDVFQGHTITQLHLGQDALNDFGQVVYRADFTDNTAAIIRATVPAPEPSQAAAFAVGLLGLGALTLQARKRAA